MRGCYTWRMRSVFLGAAFFLVVGALPTAVASPLSRCDRLVPGESKKAPETLPVTLVPERERGSDPAPLAATSSEKSYQNYLKGLTELNEASRTSLPKAVQLFQKSIKEDYNFAPAYLGLAETLAALSVFERFDGNGKNGDALAVGARKELAKAQLLRPELAKLREKRIKRYLKADPKKLCAGTP